MDSTGVYSILLRPRDILLHPRRRHRPRTHCKSIRRSLSLLVHIATTTRERDAILEDDAVFEKIDAEPLSYWYMRTSMPAICWYEMGIWWGSSIGRYPEYPLSELLGVAVILQISGPRRYGNEEWAEQEEVEWKGYYLGEVEHVARQRGWAGKDSTMVMGGGHHVMQKARSVMFP